MEKQISPTEFQAIRQASDKKQRRILADNIERLPSRQPFKAKKLSERKKAEDKK